VLQGTLEANVLNEPDEIVREAHRHLGLIDPAVGAAARQVGHGG
jgi:hypothetical protein